MVGVFFVGWSVVGFSFGRWSIFGLIGAGGGRSSISNVVGG